LKNLIACHRKNLCGCARLPITWSIKSQTLPKPLTAPYASGPDLLSARALESWADARIDQAQAEGRLDASLSAGYEHMTFGFPVRGIDDFR